MTQANWKVESTRSWVVLPGLLLLGLLSVSESAFSVVGGTAVTPGQYPFITTIWIDDDNDGNAEPFCAGTLISSKWILSAAHCFSEENAQYTNFPERMYVPLGATDITAQNSFTQILSVTTHPEYNSQTRTADIALLELNGVYTGEAVAVPSFSSLVPQLGELSKVLGWGRTSEEGNSSALLLETNLPVRSHISCTRVFGENQDRNATFCAGGEPNNNRDACKGDSGGPLLVRRDGKYVQAGIVNFGFGCGRPGLSGLYTRVSNYADWIIAVTGITDNFDHYGRVIPDDGRFPELVADTIVDSTVEIGELDIYTATGLSEINLTSNTGDADLHIYSGETFETSEQICESTNESPEDSCMLSETSDRVFIGVFGFETSNDYTISAKSADEPTVNQTTEPDDTGTAPQAMDSPGSVSMLSMNSSGGGAASFFFALLGIVGLALRLGKSLKH